MSLSSNAITIGSDLLVDLNDPLPNSSPTSAGDADVSTWLSGLITNYNGLYDPDIPTALTLSFKVGNTGSGAPAGFPNFASSVTQLTFPVGSYDYLVLHWGGKDQRTAGAVWEAYYVGNVTTSTIGLPSTLVLDDVRTNGLSDYRIYNHTPVPDGGTTVVLIGGALGGLALLFRRRA